jgi:phosphoglycerate dehydrogenase-like enzyme
MSMPALERLAILDDWQGVALRLADWSRLPPGLAPVVFRDHLVGEDALVERLAPFDALVIMRERTPFPASLIARLPRLKLLVTTGEKNRSVDVAACTARGITLCGTPSVASPTPELAWGLIISLARRIPEEAANLRAGRWQESVGRGLDGRTLGLLGLGRLGARMARIGAAFGMRVTAWSQNLTAERAAEAGATRVDKAMLFAEADVISIHLQLSERTRGLVGAAELGAMKPDALLVNTSRGPIVDGEALLVALREGRIGGAALDVFDVEPLPAGDAWRSAPRLLATPHLGYVTEENYRGMYGAAVEAVLGYLAERPVGVIGG